MTAASQWLHATTGRIAGDAHSWLTAVHWTHDLATKGLYTPTQTHGPKWGATTLAIAQEIARLKVCRPGIAYLMRKLRLSERSVQYHLTMLRETGLLVYRSKGTRARGVAPQASVYERTIPAAFDEEHGIRTVGEGVQRRPVGAASESRTVLGRLAKKAARKVRRRPPRTAVSGRGRCTPMEGGSTGTSSADRTYSPPESKLASGNGKSSARKSVNSVPRKLNKIGRRYQLAKELIQTVPWLQRASVPRIAWIIRHVAGAGWTALQVQAIAEQERPILASQVHRPSGLLANRLGSLHNLYDTPARRQTAVQAWQDSLTQEKARHHEAAQHTDQVQHATAASVRNLMAEAVRRTRALAYGPRPGDEEGAFTIDCENDTPPLNLEDLDPSWIKQVRADAAKDLSSITIALASGLNERDARRLYTNWLVDQAIVAERTLTPAF
ncbi:transcriptional regulator [Streptomyces pseudovenezuelae]|uniref:transcriptional regulator n=1 Tax=Streptomyces pseudovenezuelae TaxID=67350 RepID=UPI002E8047F6|nr:transcriptional regulator [Streptomyces pseudovenezuelae]WUA94538.1 transcriptional regulator [Streptomyces pseudovenezuelae]